MEDPRAPDRRDPRAVAGGRTGGGEVERERALGLHACRRCSDGVRLAAQAGSGFGSQEDLIARGAEALAAITGTFVGTLAAAVAGLTEAKAIRKALDRAARRFNDVQAARVIEREILTGVMLGALDSDWEVRNEKAARVERFADRTLAFTGHPMAKAIEAFSKRRVLTPEAFKKLRAKARRKAFTVAGATSTEMIQTVKDELVKRVEDEADLRLFQTFMKERLESAGWTPASNGHVETIFRTNIASAYSAGRYEQMTQPDVIKARPYAQVLTPNDGPPRQRPWHQKAHGRVFDLSELSPEMFTPWGFNCRCRFRSLSARQLKALGLEVTPASWLRDNGLPDPGFTGGVR